MPESPHISVVVPIHNRAEDVDAIYSKIRQVLEARAEAFEIVFVDDGSTDATCERLAALGKGDPRLRLLELDGTFGDAAALTAGFQHSAGNIVVTIGAEDDNVAGIPKLLDGLESNGIHVVAGRRVAPHKGSLLATGLSQLVDALTVRVTGLPIYDPGCRLKAYRRKCLRPIQLPPDADYFLPALLGVTASEVAEVAVADRGRPRHHTIARSIAILSDLLSLRIVLADAHRAEITFALFTAGAAAVGAIAMRKSPLLTTACDVLALLSGLIWWNARRFNRAQRDGVYRLRENDN